MNETFFVVLLFASGISLLLAYFVFGRFSYEIRDSIFVVERRLFFFIPFGKRRIPIENIQEIRPLKGFWDVLRGAEVYGNLFLRRGVLVVLKRGFFKRLFITPPNVAELTNSLEQELVKSSGL
jgi:hypothetical protein